MILIYTFVHRYIALWDVEKSHYIYWFWMFVFCATSSTIVSGALAERCQLGAYIVYSLVTSTFIYPPVAHWVWSDQGWLNLQGFEDYAGAGVVHMLGGVIGLVGTVIMGPRTGRFSKTGEVIDIPGHSIALTSLGFFIIIFAFLSFNACATGSISTDEDLILVQNAIVNTVIGAASSGLTTLILFKLFGKKKWSLMMMMNGTLTGIVASAAFCNKADTFMTFIVGIFASGVFAASKFGLIRIKVDDPLDVIPVHLGGGFVGVLATPFVRGNRNLLRLPLAVETAGCDVLKHGEPAYPSEAWQEFQYQSSGGLPPNMGSGVDLSSDVQTFQGAISGKV